MTYQLDIFIAVVYLCMEFGRFFFTVDSVVELYVSFAVDCISDAKLTRLKRI